MLAIKFAFTANRYHATQWGRHVNEGVHEWPPAPWRILRGLVATWRRTLPELSPSCVVPVLEALASENPQYALPTASTGHTRHYMPYYEGTKKRTTLVIDSFVAIKPKEALYAVWPNLHLEAEQKKALATILRHLPYLGRAESWVEAELVADCPAKINSFALESGSMPDRDWEIVRTLVPRKPIKLKDLLVETSDLRGSGRIDPEGAEWWLYVRKPDCFTAFRTPRIESSAQGVNAKVVRFMLAGPVLPMAFDALRWGDLVRKCVMAQYGRKNEGMSPMLSGKDRSATPLQGHRHAFYLPTDEDGDGRLDHLTVWAPEGLNDQEFQAVISVRTLNPGEQRQNVHLIYQAHGGVEDFVEVSQLFGSAKHWRSLTPYVLTRHIKYRRPRDENGRKRMVDGPEDQIRREVHQRWPEGPGLAGESWHDPRQRIEPMQKGVSRGFRPSEFFRYRKGGSYGGGAFNFDIEFEESVSGPVAMGFACHYGLGLFVPKPT